MIQSYPIEFWNTLTTSRIRPHKLMLKVNCLIIFLRNLDPSSSLCNGTWLVCKFLLHDAQTTSRHYKSNRVLLPHIPLKAFTLGKYIFQFRRK